MSNCNCEDIIIKISEEGVDGNGIVNIELISEVGLEKTYRINFTNGTHFDYVVTDGSSIQSIEKTSTQGLVDTYTITLTDGETFSFEVVNGNGIASIVKTKTENLTDTYTISFTDGTSTTFTVNNGNSITGVTKVSTQVLTDTYRIGYSDTGKAPDTFTVVNGRGITAIAKVSSSGLQDEYRISYNDGTSSNFTVTNGMPATHSWNGTILTITSASGTSSADLKGEKGDSATIAIGTVTTGAEGSSASVTNRGDEHDAIWDITIPRGNTGNGISSITLLSQSGLVKTYRITYTNGTHFDFSVSDGNGIASIEKTATVGAVDTYTVTFTDPTAEPFSYDVTNGSDEWGAIVGDLSDQTDLQTALDSKAPVIVENASAGLVTFADGADNLPLSALTVYVEPVQSGSGDPSPENVRPISGSTQAVVTGAGLNMANVFRDGKAPSITNGALVNVATASRTDYIKIEPSTVYVLSAKSSVEMYVFYYDENKAFISYSTNTTTALAVTSPNNAHWAMLRLSTNDYSSYDFQLEQGSTATSYVTPNIRTLTIPFGQTVYGAQVDVLKGEMRVTHDIRDMGEMSWILQASWGGHDTFYAEARAMKPVGSAEVADIKSSIYRPVSANRMYIDGFNATICQNSNGVRVINNAYSDATTFKSAMSGVQLVYELATPITIPLTAQQLSSLLGVNNIWADTGDVDVNYRADTKLFVEKSIESAVTAVKRIMTTTTDTMVAPKNLTSGEIVIVGDELYKATSNIASGATLTVGSNVVKVTLAEWVASLVA